MRKINAWGKSKKESEKEAQLEEEEEQNGAQGFFIQVLPKGLGLVSSRNPFLFFYFLQI